ncbi:winged helix-turn-helix transcriptional regulator [Pelosinus sp. sgz500959]|uniref:winged helix-turn-helix transcriptional regulator n=1 Tax=Pelosinus sp. sgz500959 TaxID=3242472 RepID=UPI003671AA90
MASEQELAQYLNVFRESEKSLECPVKCALELIGGKWKLRILAQLLSNEVVRFNELKREISGITNTMLSNSLRELERDELITRHQYNEMPVKVEYALTDKGRKLLPVFYELTTWWNNYRKEEIIIKKITHSQFTL